MHVTVNIIAYEISDRYTNNPKQTSSGSRQISSFQRKFNVKKPQKTHNLKKKSSLWPSDITDLFKANPINPTSSVFQNKNLLNTKYSSPSEISKDFNLDSFMAQEIDEMTSPKIKRNFKKSSKTKKILKRRKNRFSLFPQSMLSSSSIIKKTSQSAADKSLFKDHEGDIAMPSEGTYQSYDIPHSAKKRFSEFGQFSSGGIRRHFPQHHQLPVPNQAHVKRAPLPFHGKPSARHDHISHQVSRGRNSQRHLSARPPPRMAPAAVTRQASTWKSHKVFHQYVFLLYLFYVYIYTYMNANIIFYF